MQKVRGRHEPGFQINATKAFEQFASKLSDIELDNSINANSNMMHFIQIKSADLAHKDETLPSLLCMGCLNIVGQAEDSFNGWRIFKWATAIKFPQHTQFASYETEKWVAAQILSITESQGVRKFLVEWGGDVILVCIRPCRLTCLMCSKPVLVTSLLTWSLLADVAFHARSVLLLVIFSQTVAPTTQPTSESGTRLQNAVQASHRSR